MKTTANQSLWDVTNTMFRKYLIALNTYTRMMKDLKSIT